MKNAEKNVQKDLLNLGTEQRALGILSRCLDEHTIKHDLNKESILMKFPNGTLVEIIVKVIKDNFETPY
jgi:hypothetical protein